MPGRSTAIVGRNGGQISAYQFRKMFAAGAKAVSAIQKYRKGKRKRGRGPKKKKSTKKKKPSKKKGAKTSSKKKSLPSNKSVARKYGHDGCSMSVSQSTNWWTSHTSIPEAAGYDVDPEFDTIAMSNDGVTPDVTASCTLLHQKPGLTGADCLFQQGTISNNEMQYSILNLGLRYAGTHPVDVPDDVAFIGSEIQSTLTDATEVWEGRLAWDKWKCDSLHISIDWQGKPPAGRYRIIRGSTAKVRMMRSSGQSLVPDPKVGAAQLIPWNSYHSIDEIVSCETQKMSAYETLAREYGQVSGMNQGESAPSVGMFPAVNTPVTLSVPGAATAELTPGVKLFTDHDCAQDRTWKTISSATKKGKMQITLNHGGKFVPTKDTTAFGSNTLPIILFQFSNKTIYTNKKKVVKLGVRPTAMEEEAPPAEPEVLYANTTWRNSTHLTIPALVRTDSDETSISFDNGLTLMFGADSTVIYKKNSYTCPGVINAETKAITFTNASLNLSAIITAPVIPTPTEVKVAIGAKPKHEIRIDADSDNVDIMQTQYSDEIPVRRIANISYVSTYRFRGKRQTRVPETQISEGPSQRNYLPYKQLVSSYTF